jgi:hypothetical protein
VDSEGPTLIFYYGGRVWQELLEGEGAYLDRRLLSDGRDRRLSQRRAPQLFWADGQVWIRNQHDQNRLVVINEDGLIYRVPPGAAQQLGAGDSSVYVAPKCEVGITITGVKQVTVPPPGDTLDGTRSCNADLEVGRRLEENARFRTAVYVRFQEFMTPTADPRVLPASQVELCAPSMNQEIVNQAQRMIKEITGLDATVELGDWLTHRGILLAGHYREVTHFACGHTERS